MLTVGRRSLSRSSSPARPPTPPNHDTLLHAYGLLEVALSHYFPGTTEPDDASVRATAKAESDSTLDELLAPLVMLLCKLVVGDTGARERMREWLLPANLDRTVVLESRADTLGRLLRLLTSVYHPRLNMISGELLYAMCNHDGPSFLLHTAPLLIRRTCIQQRRSSRKWATVMLLASFLIRASSLALPQEMLRAPRIPQAPKSILSQVLSRKSARRLK